MNEIRRDTLYTPIKASTNENEAPNEEMTPPIWRRATPAVVASTKSNRVEETPRTVSATPDSPFLHTTTPTPFSLRCHEPSPPLLQGSISEEDSPHVHPALVRFSYDKHDTSRKTEESVRALFHEDDHQHRVLQPLDLHPGRGDARLRNSRGGTHLPTWEHDRHFPTKPKATRKEGVYRSKKALFRRNWQLSSDSNLSNDLHQLSSSIKGGLERRRSRGKETCSSTSPDTSLYVSSSEEHSTTLTPDSSPSPTGRTVWVGPTPTHRRQIPLRLLPSGDLADCASKPARWKVPGLKVLFRLTHTRAILWMLCLTGLLSMSTTVLTNRALTTYDGIFMPIPPPTSHYHVLFRKDTFGQPKRRKHLESLRGLAPQPDPKSDTPVNIFHNMGISRPLHLNSLSHIQSTAKKATKLRPVKAHVKPDAADDDKWGKAIVNKLQDDSVDTDDDGENDDGHHHNADDESTVDDANTDDEATEAAPDQQPSDPSIGVITKVVAPSNTGATRAIFDYQDVHLYITKRLGWGVAERAFRMRVVFLNAAGTNLAPKSRSVALYPSDFTDNTQLYSILDSSDERMNTMERRTPLEQGECVPMKDWQTTFHPTCNAIHELGMSHMGRSQADQFTLFGMKGYWRNAWRVDQHGDWSKVDTVVLKTLKFNHRFEDKHFEHNRVDAIVMERLTGSPHVMQMFSFCAHSVITEFADGKRLNELANDLKDTPMARLKIARDIAMGLADVHAIDGEGNATFVHLDVNPANIVNIGGRLKLNDFNIGILRRWNTTSNRPCGFPAQYPNPQWRSPEEARNEQNLTEKVDVFSLGHILFRLICRHEPWNKLEPGGKPPKEVINEKVKRGVLPTIPEDILASKDPEVVAIRQAMLKCYTFDPAKRPSAREIADSLHSQLLKLAYM